MRLLFGQLLEKLGLLFNSDILSHWAFVKDVYSSFVMTMALLDVDVDDSIHDKKWYLLVSSLSLSLSLSLF